MTDHPRRMVPGDFVLKDWVVERFGPNRIRIK